MPHNLVIPPVGFIPGAPGPEQGGAPAPVSPFQRFTGRAPTSLDALRLLQAGGTQAESKRLLREAAGLPQQRQGVGTFGGVASTGPVRARWTAAPTPFYQAFLRRPEQFQRPALAGRRQTRASITSLNQPF